MVTVTHDGLAQFSMRVTEPMIYVQDQSAPQPDKGPLADREQHRSAAAALLTNPSLPALIPALSSGWAALAV